MAKRKGKKAKKALKTIRRQVKKAASDDKVTKKEVKQIKKKAQKKGIDTKKFKVVKQVKKVAKNRSLKTIRKQIKKAGKDGKVSSKELNQIKTKAKKKSINTKKLGFKFNTGKGVKKQFNKYVNKQGKKGNDIKYPKKTLKGIKGKGKYLLKTGITGDKQLDKYLEKNILEKPIMQPRKHTKVTWKPDRVERNVAQQWGKRFKSDAFKPKRLKVSTDSSGRLGNYTNKKTGKFNHNKYLADVREGMVSRAKKRGLQGNVKKALSRTAPKMPGQAEPKYGSAINDLKNKLGKIDYSKKIASTTSKLTDETVKSDADKYKKTGLNIIKRRSSEDGAVPKTLSK